VEGDLSEPPIEAWRLSIVYREARPTRADIAEELSARIRDFGKEPPDRVRKRLLRESESVVASRRRDAEQLLALHRTWLQERGEPYTDEERDLLAERSTPAKPRRGRPAGTMQDDLELCLAIDRRVRDGLSVNAASKAVRNLPMFRHLDARSVRERYARYMGAEKRDAKPGLRTRGRKRVRAQRALEALGECKPGSLDPV
jgi:hypothetical protein